MTKSWHSLDQIRNDLAHAGTNTAATQPSTAEQLRTAAKVLRGPDGTITVTIPADAAESLSQWLDFEADFIDRLPGAEYKPRTDRALAVARAITGDTT